MREVAAEIEDRLKRDLQPQRLELRDDSAMHAGHRGATSGGGHFTALIVSTAFAGQSLLERHRRVNETLGDMFGQQIHAFSMTTLTPDEWKARGGE